MINSRLLSACFICFFIAACDTQKKTTSVETTSEIKTAPEKTAKQETAIIKTRPVLNLSIDNMNIDHPINNDNFLYTSKELAEKNNALFKKLSKNKIEPDINLSGKLLTDEDKVENEEYLDSINGVQINIKGSFN